MIDQITNAGKQTYQSNVNNSSATGSSSSQSKTVQRKAFETQEIFGHKMTAEEVEGSVKKVNQELRSMESNLRFSIHEKTKQIMVKVVNTQTHEVIREIPSEKILDMVAAMMERAGLLMDKRG